jgi:hypothetical protein
LKDKYNEDSDEFTEFEMNSGKDKTGAAITGDNSTYNKYPPYKIDLFGIPGYGLNKIINKKRDDETK